MRIGYLCTDEVNVRLAAGAARDCGAALEGPSPHGAAPDSEFDAVLYDLDHLPPNCEQAAREALSRVPLRIPTAVHGYDLGADHESDLRARGMIVARRLGPGLIRSLCRAAVSVHGVPRRDQEIVRGVMPYASDSKRLARGGTAGLARRRGFAGALQGGFEGCSETV